MIERTVLVPHGQLPFYQVGFGGEVRNSKGEYIRTERTIAIDPITSTVIKRVIDGAEFTEGVA